jgi:hypothetical protein
MCLTLRVRPGGSGAVVRIEGEIDVCVADRLQELLLRIMQAHAPRLHSCRLRACAAVKARQMHEVMPKQRPGEQVVTDQNLTGRRRRNHLIWGCGRPAAAEA